MHFDFDNYNDVYKHLKIKMRYLTYESMILIQVFPKMF